MYILNFVTLHSNPAAFLGGDNESGCLRLMRFQSNVDLYQALPNHRIASMISRSELDNPLVNGDIEYTSIPTSKVTVVSIAVSPSIDGEALERVARELRELPVPPLLIREMIEVPGAESVFRVLVENNVMPLPWSDVQQILTKRG